jgi:hypothetical protein
VGYEDAPSTKMIATNCAICSRPLCDAVSVERGTGPECAKKHGLFESQARPDWSAAEAALSSGSLFDQLLEKNRVGFGDDVRSTVNVLVHAIACGQGSPLVVRCAEAIWHLGFRNLVLAIATHRTSAIRAIVVRKGDFGFDVEAPYDEEAVAGFRNLGGRWDGKGKTWCVPRPMRKGLWAVLKACYPAGTLVLGEKPSIL